MEFLKTRNRRSLISGIVYAALNIGLVVALFFSIYVTGSIYLAFALVLLSKWRVLAVRPRYWFANIQANLVDFIVSIGLVVFMYLVAVSKAPALEVWVAQIIIMIAYAVWLLLIKPRSKRAFVVVQAGSALFIGMAALFMVSYEWFVSAVVLIAGLIGYSSARHVLSNYEEKYTTLVSLSWGFVLAEISWLAYHWSIGYQLPGVTSLLLPQVSIIAICFGFVSYQIYDSYHRHERVKLNDVLLPIIFTISITLLLVLFLNNMTVI